MKVERRDGGGGQQQQQQQTTENVSERIFFVMRGKPTKNFRPQKRIRLREWPNLGVASAAGLPSALHFDEAERVVLCLCAYSDLLALLPELVDVDVDAHMHSYYHSSNSHPVKCK